MLQKIRIYLQLIISIIFLLSLVFMSSCVDADNSSQILTGTNPDSGNTSETNTEENKDEESSETDNDKDKKEEINSNSLLERFKSKVIPVAVTLASAIVLLIVLGFILRKIKKFGLEKLSKYKDDNTVDTKKSEDNFSRIISLINTVLKVVILVTAIIISLNILELVKFPGFKLETIMHWLLTRGINIIITLVAVYVFLKVVEIVLDRIKIVLLSKYEQDKSLKAIDSRKRSETLSRLAGYILKLIIWIAGIIVILSQLSIDIAPLLASAGIVGVAIGLGAQNLIKDIIQGTFILIENQYHVGDVVSVAGVAGLVEEFNIRYTRMRNLSGSVFFIPNGEIKVVENMTKEWSRALVDIGIAYKENVDYVMNVIEEVGKELCEDENYKDIILDPMEILGVDSLGNSSVTIRTLIKTVPLQQWQIARELKRRIKNTFDEKGIEIPFPHITVAIGDEAGKGNINVLMKHYEEEATSNRVKQINENKQKTMDEGEDEKKTNPTSIYGDEHSEEGDAGEGR